MEESICFTWGNVSVSHGCLYVSMSEVDKIPQGLYSRKHDENMEVSIMRKDLISVSL